jgi:alpha/beta superfamily hydrolase
MPDPRSEALVVEQVQFRAGPYLLEGRLAYPETRPPSAAAVLAGPHPLLGGDLDNNVVRALADGLAERGLATLRFNYRGAGRSQGPAIDVAAHLARFWETSHVPDERELHADLDGAITFLRGLVGEGLPLILVGYSFGCALLPLARGNATEGVPSGATSLVLIAPTVGRHDYSAYAEVSRPLLVIASEDDFASDALELQRWFDGLAGPRRLIQGRLDNHFFRGHEAWLVDTVLAFLEGEGGKSPCS